MENTNETADNLIDKCRYIGTMHGAFFGTCYEKRIKESNNCEYHTCHFPGCNSQVKEHWASVPFQFCEIHRCKIGGPFSCPGGKYEDSDLCIDHICSVCKPGCKGIPCRKHICRKWSCREPVPLGIFCVKHKCKLKNCENPAYSGYCTTHKCQWNKCNNKKMDPDNGSSSPYKGSEPHGNSEAYCKAHKCEMCSHPKRDGNGILYYQGCSFHSCPYEEHHCENLRGKNFMGLCDTHKNVWDR